MARYRNNLPQQSGELFLTDGGLETTLVFHDKRDLPCFAAFDLLKDTEGTERLRRYFRGYAELAKRYNTSFILESVTWRANADWGAKLGYSKERLADANRKSIAMLEHVRNEYETENNKMVISGALGPRGDGYNPAEIMTNQDAERYHSEQIETFAETAADMVTAFTITNIPEAIGIVRAAKSAGIPSVISFTVETDGRLPTGEPLGEAITKVEDATKGAPAYYMINCAHPTHFEHILKKGEPWMERIRGLRANPSTLSHAELDEAEELDDGNPIEFGSQYRQLRNVFTNLNVLGGCCGSDERHIEAICKACIK